MTVAETLPPEVCIVGHGPGGLTCLRSWIERRRPDLHEKLSNAAGMDDCLAILNAETGLSFSGSDNVDESCWAFLDALVDISEVSA